MKEVPVVDIKAIDLRKLYQKGYNMLEELCHEADAPIVKTKIFSKETITIYELSAAKVLYDPGNFGRKGAMLKLALKVLLGQGGVQTLDGTAHRHRKSILVDLVTPGRVGGYHRTLGRGLTQALEARYGRSEPFDLGKMVFFISICEWADINLSAISKDEAEELAEYQISMISGAFISPIDHIKGVENRKKLEKRAQGLTEEVRQNPVVGEESMALYTSANTTGLDDRLLPLGVAAVKLLNVVRPTVVLTVWVALIGHALFSRPNPYQQLKNDFSTLQDPSTQETGRYCPFLPMLPATSLKEVEVDGYRIPEGSWVTLDLHGIDHDRRIVEVPDSFMIKRYVGRAKGISYKGEHEMIAQGGENFRQVHRCAGEWITLHNLRVFSDQLVDKFEFSIPE